MAEVCSWSGDKRPRRLAQGVRVADLTAVTRGGTGCNRIGGYSVHGQDGGIDRGKADICSLAGTFQLIKRRGFEYPRLIVRERSRCKLSKLKGKKRGTQIAFLPLTIIIIMASHAETSGLEGDALQYLNGVDVSRVEDGAL
jgi:hypothetical protein